MCNRCLLDEWVNESVWGDDIAKDGALDSGSHWESLALLIPQGECYRHAQWQESPVELINTPSGDSEPETRGPGICFFADVLLLWSETRFRCFWAWEPLLKGYGSGSQDTTSTALTDVCKFPRSGKRCLWALLPFLPENLCIMLDCNAEWCLALLP